MKVLLTTDAGFIGSHLVDRLVNKGVEVVVIDSLEKQVHLHFPKYLIPKPSFFLSQLEDYPLLDYIFSKPQSYYAAKDENKLTKKEIEELLESIFKKVFNFQRIILMVIND